jgi:AcrR family transcriptional regulator
MNAYWHHDMAAISVNSVCVVAGVSKPSLYREFGSEDGLTAAVLERYSQIVLGPLEELLSSTASFAIKWQSMITFVSQNPVMERGCLYTKMRFTSPRFGIKTQAMISSIEAHTIECYVQFFKKAATNGEWQGAISAELAALYLHEQLGLAVSQRASGKPSEYVHELLELAISALV